jgi:hypothetical protein
MRKMPLSLAVLGTVLVPLLSAAPAQAQATRTWVSGVGDDFNPCSRTAPCKTFAGAISKTAVHGEINCIDPGGFGSVTIVKSITIDCHEIFASILNSSANGIVINFDNFVAAGESQKTVRLRNLNLNGANTGFRGIRIVGGAASANSEVIIEDLLIDGNFGSPGHGIIDERTGGGELYISNTTVRNNGQIGIMISPASGSTTINASLNGVKSQSNGNAGLVVGPGVKAMVRNSVFSGNNNVGVDVEGGGAQATVADSVMSGNGNFGVFTNATVRLGNNDIAFNGTGISGATSSFVTNRISGNTAAGTAPTPIPPSPSNPSGQQ